MRDVLVRFARLAPLRGRIRVRRDDALTAAYPARFGATLHTRMPDGRTETVAIADAWGDPERPMDADAVRAKFDRLAAGAGMAADRAQAIAEAILALPRSGDGAAVHAALRHAATA